MNAKDLMVATIISISPESSVLDAAKTMLHHHISGLPVVDSGGLLVGMITAGDLMRRAEIATELRRAGFAEFEAGSERLAADYVRAHGKHVGQVMTRTLHTVGEGDPIQKVVDIMDRYDVKRVPVTNGQKLVGLISRTDLLRALVEAAQHPQDEANDDDAIQRKIFAIYTREPWAPLANIDLSVHAGTVELAGTIANEVQRSALIAAAESVRGVRSVIDHLELTKSPLGQAPF